jgi:chitin deacetylase
VENTIFMMGQLTRLLLREFYSINSLTIPLTTSRVQTRFDDGPLPPATKLYSFLQENKQAATHFMIGVNILANPDLFVTAFNSGDDLAVHTWSHPWMTAQTSERIVAELGWTMQIIHDSSQGRVPRF